MMDQQNFVPSRPVSADSVVVVARGSRTSVESLARELGLKLGGQNELTIRRIKRGKNY
jgi:DNA topoisomerase-1